jgi:ATP-dependent protease HslVU (ClpYQ) ATPase subunit
MKLYNMICFHFSMVLKLQSTLVSFLIYSKFYAEVKIDTRNILFVGAGAFEKVKPHDLVLELQGRMPVQVMMESLKVEDFIKILT